VSEAKRRRTTGSASDDEYSLLKAQFEALGIDTSRPGFYDDPAFLAEEQRNRHFLETYGRWVLTRARSDEEDTRVREVVPRLAEIIVGRLEHHQWLGACIAITGMVSRMLDRMGIWNCAFTGSLTIEHAVGSEVESRHFAIVDELEGGNTSTGHQWLAVPPFNIVDITLRYQRWGSDEFRRYLPSYVLAETTELVRPRAEDVVSPEVRAAFAMREGRQDAHLHHRLFPDQARFSRIFPAHKIKNGLLELRYVPAGATASDVPLEDVNAEGDQGVPAIVIWREDVVPAFGLSSD
jgi:hypothetical protein